MLGTIVTGLFVALSMTAGRCLGQRQEVYRRRQPRWKGFRSPRCFSDRRYGRRSLQGYGRPAVNPMIKIINIVAILLLAVVGGA